MGKGLSGCGTRHLQAWGRGYLVVVIDTIRQGEGGIWLWYKTPLSTGENAYEYISADNACEGMQAV